MASVHDEVDDRFCNILGSVVFVGNKELSRKAAHLDLKIRPAWQWHPYRPVPLLVARRVGASSLSSSGTQ